MKKGMIALAVLVVIVGGLSMGCIGVTEPEEPENPTIAGLTAKGLQVKADVAERQARGFVQYTGTNNTFVPENNTTSEVEVITYKDAPIINYCRCYPKYPDNVVGFDTPMERAYVYQAMLNDKVASIDSLTVSQYIPGCTEKIAYMEYYQGYYQGLQDKYQKMYCTVGNKEIGDFEIERAVNMTVNGSA